MTSWSQLRLVHSHHHLRPRSPQSTQQTQSPCHSLVTVQKVQRLRTPQTLSAAGRRLSRCLAVSLFIFLQTRLIINKLPIIYYEIVCI
jgi:hypothetical protein